MSRIRLFQVITRMVRGGAQQIVLDLLRGLDRERFEPIFVAGTETGAEGSLWDEVERLGITVYRLPELVRNISPRSDYSAYRQLRRLIARERPDVVHSHTSKAGLLGSLAARREEAPLVVLSPHGHILGGGAKIPGVPEHGLKRRILAKLARKSGDLADVIIAPNQTELIEGIALGLWPEERSVCVPNGVDTERFAPRERETARRALGLSSHEYLIGVAARLTREKGIDVAIRALPSVACARLVVIGDGPELGALRELARHLGVADRVEFYGLCRQMPELLPALDLCVVPSRTEAHGMVAAEALSCEIPVVSSDVGGLRSLVIDGTTGLRVPPDNALALAAALRTLIGDPDYAKKLARAGRRRMVEEYSIERMIIQTESIYIEASERQNAKKHTSTWVVAR